MKLLINSVISTEGAIFFTLDIEDFYLNTLLKRFKYLHLRMKDIPEDVIKQYNLKEKAMPEGLIYVEVRKGMYGLPQAGLLAQELLEKRLDKHGYWQSQYTPGLWIHDWRPVQFTLVMDNFGIKYVGEENKNHLINALKENNEIAIGEGGTKYIGLTLQWDYKQRCVHLSMLGYKQQAFTRFNHAPPTRIQNQPYPHVPPKYGARLQYAKEADMTPLLPKEGKKFIQQVTGTFLYYARAVDLTMLAALSAIVADQAAPTETAMARCKQFLDYAASQEDAVITFHASDMVLAGHSDVSYLSEKEARLRAGGHWFMSEDTKYPAQ